jgi:ribosomal protein S18 acetylase RimI-like enzyme
MKKSIDEIIIRKWTTKDFAIIREILKITWLDTYINFIPESDLLFYLNETYNDEKLSLLFGNPDTTFHLAAINSSIAGIMRITDSKNEKRFYLNSLYVLPEYQGYGIGKKLSAIAEKTALALGYDEIWLGVMEQNISSVEWYTKNGYVFTQSEPFQMGKTIVNHFIGYKKLSGKI